MYDAEQETRQEGQENDDFEVIDLSSDTASAGNTGVGASPTPTLQSSCVSLRSRLTLRQRRIQLILTSGVFVLVLLFILGSIAPLRDAVALRLFGPTPSPPVAPLPPTKPLAHTDLFYIQILPDWGSVSIDGQVLFPLPVVGQDAPIHLARGMHHFVWHADPLWNMSCSLMVPNLTEHNTCQYAPLFSASADIVGPAGLVAWSITFKGSLDTLPAAQRDSLIFTSQAVLDGLQSSDTVQPGEQYAYYSSTSLVVDTATQPLRATLRFHLDTNDISGGICFPSNLSCKLQGQDCRQFCGLPPAQGQSKTSGASSTSIWNALAITYSSWEYTTADGHGVTQDQTDALRSTSLLEYLTILQITWDGTIWHVTIALHSPDPTIAALHNPACAAAQLETSRGYYQVVGVGTQAAVNWQFSSGTDSAAGCLATAAIRNNIDPTTISFSSGASGAVSYCLYRFGLFLALNEAARHNWPTMPLANAYEQQLAQQWAALL